MLFSIRIPASTSTLTRRVSIAWCSLIDELISRLQEQLEMEYDKDDEANDGQSGKDVESLEAQIAH